MSVFLLVAVVAACMIGWLSITSKKTELTEESNAATNQLIGFLAPYSKCTEQLAVNPEVKHIMTETKAGDDIRKAEKMDTVMENLEGMAATDPENIMAVWIADLDASVISQSDGFTSEEGWDITSREWYRCIETKQTVFTEPYVDSSTGKMILSAVSPVYDDGGDVLGAAGIDIALDHMTEIMSGYKIGSKGYILLLSQSGTLLYHPQSDIIQQNVRDIDISKNVIEAVESGKDAFLKYKTGGVTKFGYLQHSGEVGYIVLSCLPMSDRKSVV